MNNLLKNFAKDISAAVQLSDVDKLRVKYLGKKSFITSEMKRLPNVPGEERAKLGKFLNQAKSKIQEAIETKVEEIESKKDFEPIDISMPGKSLFEKAKLGHMHPTNIVLKETYRVFTELGFAIVDSPEIETDWYNFESLNMPEIHPAREMQDTFYIKNTKQKLLPRTHTSAMQVRFMENNKPPFKVLLSGKAFRNENEDATHAWSFHQIEGIVVGENVSVTDMKGTLAQIVRKQLGEDIQIRYRASYFPYTEPSVEVDAKFNGKWLELGGAGMIHPEVLKNGGIDPEKYSGFAFGWGAERLTVIKYGITDLRQLWRPKFEYLEQF